MTRIHIERRTPSQSPLLWWVVGLIGLIAIAIILWMLYVRRFTPG